LDNEQKVWYKYPHLERIDTTEVDGLLHLPHIWVEPKIDGANASVLIDKDGVLRGAKRSQVLGQGDDFRGLTAHIYENQQKFLDFFEKYPNHIIYGEWLVKHTITWYRLSAWNQFYAFDILNLNTGKFYSPDKRVEMLMEFEINTVPPICKLKGPLVTEAHMEQLHWYANNNNYLIDDKNKVGEGVVIKAFHENGEPFVNRYGRTTWGKIVRQEFKEKNYLAMGSPEKNLKVEPEELFVNEYVTPGRIEKIKQKIMTEKNSGWKSQYIGELLGRTYYDVFTEELWRFVQKNKIKSINFKVLNQLCIIKTKQIVGL